MHRELLAEIIDEDENWSSYHSLIEKSIAQLETQIFSHLNFPKTLTRIELSILLINDNYMKSLNQQYRGKKKTTNILSFPAEHITYTDLNNFSTEDEYYAGDLLLSLTVIEAEAQASTEAILQNYLTHILLHGILHLFGYDHEKADEAELMESKETEILTKLGIRSPYI